MKLEQKTNIFELIHNRRSIRKFTNEPISDEILTEILSAGIRAPFAAQLCSVIYTRDKEKMRIKSGVYPTTNVLMIFLVDFYKLERIVK
ncbi:nitroreductase family protein, partial [Candidatus Hodarchaeum mangrovi]